MKQDNNPKCYVRSEALTVVNVDITVTWYVTYIYVDWYYVLEEQTDCMFRVNRFNLVDRGTMFLRNVAEHLPTTMRDISEDRNLMLHANPQPHPHQSFFFYSCNRPWSPIGLWDVETRTFSRQSAFRWRWDCLQWGPLVWCICSKIHLSLKLVDTLKNVLIEISWVVQNKWKQPYGEYYHVSW
jgi:hypothetical protein